MKSVLSIATATLFCGAVLAQSGCNCPSTKHTTVRTVKASCNDCNPCGERTVTTASVDLPPNPAPGTCYAKVFIPPKTKTVTERICVREASERLEVVPAVYEWAEQRILVKEGSSELEALPAEFKTGERRIEVESGYTGWHKAAGAQCDTRDKQPVTDVFCFTKSPPVYKSVETQAVSKPAEVRRVDIPAEYQTVKVQRLKCPASTKRITIPAEYQTVEKTVKVCDGRMAWQRVDCSKPHDAVTMNNDTGATKVEFVAGGR
jgi:hypothetical protein